MRKLIALIFAGLAIWGAVSVMSSQKRSSASSDLRSGGSGAVTTTVDAPQASEPLKSVPIESPKVEPIVPAETVKSLTPTPIVPAENDLGVRLRKAMDTASRAKLEYSEAVSAGTERMRASKAYSEALLRADGLDKQVKDLRKSDPSGVLPKVSSEWIKAKSVLGKIEGELLSSDPLIKSTSLALSEANKELSTVRALIQAENDRKAELARSKAEAEKWLAEAPMREKKALEDKISQLQDAGLLGQVTTERLGEVRADLLLWMVLNREEKEQVIMILRQWMKLHNISSVKIMSDRNDTVLGGYGAFTGVYVDI